MPIDITKRGNNNTMNITVSGNELNRMMRIVSQCIGLKETTLGNVEISHDNNALSIRGTNGTFAAVMSTPVMGGNGEKFCVDGETFAKVCTMCSGNVTISSDDKNCIVKGFGRTRLPIIDANIQKYVPACDDNTATIKADTFIKMYNGVSHAIGADQNRIVLTGVLVRTDINGINMAALDGFQLSTEQAECDWENGITAIIPGTFMKLIAQGIAGCDEVVLKKDGGKLEAVADGMAISCGLLNGDFPTLERIIPETFKTECLVNADILRNVLKAGSALNSKQNLVKLEITSDHIKVMNNGEKADFEAEVPCQTHGDGLKIAFNQKYLMNTINSIFTDDIVIKFSSSVSPCVAHGVNEKGIRLVLPVRVQG